MSWLSLLSYFGLGSVAFGLAYWGFATLIRKNRELQARAEKAEYQNTIKDEKIRVLELQLKEAHHPRSKSELVKLMRERQDG